jgi:hypothetical protein
MASAGDDVKRAVTAKRAAATRKRATIEARIVSIY